MKPVCRMEFWCEGRCGAGDAGGLKPVNWISCWSPADAPGGASV